MRRVDDVTLQELRRLVRECVAELMEPGNAPGPGGPPAESVTIDTDADLNAFVAHLCRLAEDPTVRSQVLAGTRRFTLGHAPATANGSVPSALKGDAQSARGRARVDSGVVTERTVATAAKHSRHLVVAPGVRLTPLALDKARDLGIRIEREV